MLVALSQVGDLKFSWGGDDFSRGVYADRHEVLAATAIADASHMRLMSLAVGCALLGTLFKINTVSVGAA